MTGRKKDPIWTHYNEIHDVNKKGSRAVCKACNKEIQGIPQRLKEHFKSCCAHVQSPGSSILFTATTTGNQAADLSIPHAASSSEPSTSASGTEHLLSPPIAKKSRVQPMTNFLVRTSEDLKKQLDHQIARAVYATNSSFRCVEHPQVKRTIEMLRPGYQPPSRFDLGNTLLEEIYNEEKEKCFSSVKDQTVNLSIDGWSNVHMEPIICGCVTTETGEVYLLESIDTSGKPHTADYLQEISKNLILKCKTQYKCRVASFVTDNASAMTRMRLDLRSDDDNDGILTYGCAAHILNLLSKDLDIREVREHVVQVVKYFRNNHEAAAKYKAEGGRSLIIPHEVRWNTLADCFQTYLSEWQTILKVCEENRNIIASAIYQKVTNMMLKRSIEDLLKIYKPIAVALDSLQRTNASLSDAVEVFKQLELTFEEQDANLNQISALKKRYKMALTPAHFLSYMLDPTKTSFALTSEEENTALEYAQSEYAGTGLLPLIIKFKSKTDPFKKVLFSEEVLRNVKPLQWWRSQLGSNDEHGELMPIFNQLFTAVASSASVERIFSTFGLVQSKLRNRLGNEKAAKLVFLFK
ncbi:uncharacterized protein LOC129911335 [Episyrphus balteatus]|nr:uncharacterized protein LOC129911335 [Episyrphus balteatus]